MPNESLMLDNFTGIVRGSDLAELEKAPPGSLFRGDNVCFDLNKNAYVCTGYSALSAAITNGPASNIHYSSAIQQILCTNAIGDIYRIHPTTGAVNLVQAGAFTAGARVSWADFPGTSATLNKVFGSEGVSYWEIASDFTATDRTGVAPLGAGIILCAHKGTMFSVRPAGHTACEIIPSAANNPLSFSASDSISCLEGGDRITAVTSLNGILRAHKPFTVFNIIGNVFSGSAKDLQKLDLSLGVGGISDPAVFVYGLNEYAVCFDGFYKFTENSFEHLSLTLQGKLKDRFNDIPYSGFVSFLSPQWGPDAGRKYIIFSYVDFELISQYFFKFDLLTGEWTEESGYPETIQGMAFSFDHLKTFIAGTKIFTFSNSPTRNATTITGNLVTNVIDYGQRAIEKAPAFLHNLIADLNGVTVYGGVDGLYPLFNLSNYISSNNIVAEIPEKVLGGVLNQFRWEKTGGGQHLTSGALLEFNAFAPRPGRSFATSRADAIEAIMTYAPVIKCGSQATTNGITSYTITHGLGEKPEGVVACHSGYTMTGLATVTNITRTQFDIVLPSNPGGSRTLYWIAVAPGRQLFDAYFKGLLNYTLGSTAKTLNHNLNVTPEVILFSKANNAARGLVVSSIDARQAILTPEAGAIDGYISLIALKQGTVDAAYFKCGTASSSPITHGLATTPTAAILIPNQGTVPNHGISTLTSTQITYSGSGSYYWAVFK